MFANQIRTTVLLAALTAVILWAGHLIGGRQGMIVALVIAGAMNVASYWFSDRIVLKMYHAREVTSVEAPELYRMARTLTDRAGLPMPRVFVIPDQAPNAFATGRNPEHAVIAVTEGLLRLMDREEVNGVLAHELAHVKNRDILIGTIAATLAGAIMILADMTRWMAIFGVGTHTDDEEGNGAMGMIGLIAMAFLAPLAAMLIQMAISRSREYLADETGAALAGTGGGLADALQKLGAYTERAPMAVRPETAHMFTVSPLSGGSLMSLFATHPPLAERILRLRRRG